MGLVASHTIDDGLPDVEDHVLDALRAGAVPDWMRPRRDGRGDVYLESQQDLARQSADGAVAMFRVFSPIAAQKDEVWGIPESLAGVVEAYLESETHANHVASLDAGQFFDGVFVVADLDDEGRVSSVSLEAKYWD